MHLGTDSISEWCLSPFFESQFAGPVAEQPRRAHAPFTVAAPPTRLQAPSAPPGRPLGATHLSPRPSPLEGEGRVRGESLSKYKTQGLTKQTGEDVVKAGKRQVRGEQLSRCQDLQEAIVINVHGFEHFRNPPDSTFLIECFELDAKSSRFTQHSDTIDLDKFDLPCHQLDHCFFGIILCCPGKRFYLDLMFTLFEWKHV